MIAENANWKAGSLMLLSLVFCLFSLAIGQEQHPANEGKSLKNPIQSDESSIAEGRKVYLRHCASCHGQSGKGDGSMALAGGTPSNLVDETWDHGSSDGEIFVVIRDGTGSDMESYKDKLTEKQIWQIVNFLRSLSRKK